MTPALASLLMLPPIRTATRLAALLLPEPSSVRHRTSTPVTIACARAACETIAPGYSVSSTIARFCVDEAAALRRCGQRPIRRRRRYQDVFSTSGPLSTVASTSAYRRAGSWRSGCQDIFAIGLLSSAANGEPIYCAIEASHGSWEPPDNPFADAARTSVANNDAPDFQMRAGTDVNAAELHSAWPPALRDTAMASPAAPDDRKRTRLSPLFPVKSRPSERSRIYDATSDRPAVEEQKSDIRSARPSPSQSPAHGLFVPRSAQRTSP
jgi:hypothetical protein